MKLQVNEAPADRAARVISGVVLVALAATGAVGTPLVYAAWFLAALMIVTGLVGFCPLYAVLRTGTAAARR